MLSWKEMIDEAKREIVLLQPEQVKEKLDQEEDLLLIDCREAEEVQNGKIAQSVFIPRGVIEMTVAQHFSERNKSIIIYCAGGGRSALAAQSLKKMGYINLASMEGGFGSWLQSGFPVEK